MQSSSFKSIFLNIFLLNLRTVFVSCGNVVHIFLELIMLIESRSNKNEQLTASIYVIDFQYPVQNRWFRW